MQRQVWLFLDETDEDTLFRALDHGQGLRRLGGRFFRGTAGDLTTRPGALETRELRQNEPWTLLIHPEVSRELVTYPVEEGPFAGWTRLDEIRSEVIAIIRPLKDAQGLAPGQVRANTHAWFGGKKVRKSAAFATWVADAMRIAETYPCTAYDWMRVAPSAAEWARGGGRLQYLFRPVGLTAAEGETPIFRPHASLKD